MDIRTSLYYKNVISSMTSPLDEGTSYISKSVYGYPFDVKYVKKCKMVVIDITLG